MSPCLYFIPSQSRCDKHANTNLSKTQLTNISSAPHNHLCSTSFLHRHNTYTYPGSNAPHVVESRRSHDNLFQENTIVGNLDTLKSMDVGHTLFVGNSFGDSVIIRYNNAARTMMSGNTCFNHTKLKVNNGATFDEKYEYGFEPIC